MSKRSKTRSVSKLDSEVKSNAHLESCPCKNTCTKEKNLKWICCDTCSQWWHIHCLGITPKESSKLETSFYFCPICSIGKLTNNVCVFSKVTETIQQKTEIKVATPDASQNAANSSKQLTDSSTVCSGLGAPAVQETSKENIVILDNIRLTPDLRSSKKLKSEINKVKPEIKVQQIYPLAGGGVALHCSDSTSQKLALTQWPASSLNSASRPHPHKVKTQSDSQTIIVKSVPIHHTEEEILHDLRAKYPSVVAVHRLQNRVRKTPFPIIKVTLSQEEAATILATHIVLFGQKLVSETCRAIKVVRCYQCQRFGHTSDTCVYEQRCVNCNNCHSLEPCSLPSRCANCDGEHRADSNRCPAYLNIRHKLDIRRMANAHCSPNLC